VTLEKATLVDDKGTEAKAFEGIQRVMLQDGVVEKALSELIPEGRWTRLKLEFSPAAEISMADGSVLAALVERREAVLSFDAADVAVSQSLALLARVPLVPGLKKIGEAWTANLLPDPQKAESYVFTSFQLDPRGRSDIWTLKDVTLADVINADLGLDITAILKGSQGFQPAASAPTQAPAP